MPRTLLIRRIAVLALVTGLSLCVAGAPSAAAAPSLAREEGQGEGIVEALRGGERQCSDLSADEFELIGEYGMGSYLGSEAAHSAMNRRMTRMMGEAGERRMHVALGHRYSGCSGGPSSSWFSSVAGMMGGRGAGGNGSGMMGSGEGRGNYSGTMMSSGGHGDGGVSALGVVLIALAAGALGAGAVALVTSRRARPRGEDAH